MKKDKIDEKKDRKQKSDQEVLEQIYDQQFIGKSLNAAYLIQ